MSRLVVALPLLLSLLLGLWPPHVYAQEECFAISQPGGVTINFNQPQVLRPGGRVEIAFQGAITVGVDARVNVGGTWALAGAVLLADWTPVFFAPIGDNSNLSGAPITYNKILILSALPLQPVTVRVCNPPEPTATPTPTPPFGCYEERLVWQESGTNSAGGTWGDGSRVIELSLIHI